jgi:glycine hydroxymethyltransferase
VLTNKYSEGYPNKRYYEGQANIDADRVARIERIKALFGAEHANVQPYSGSPANLAVYLAFCGPATPSSASASPRAATSRTAGRSAITGKFFAASLTACGKKTTSSTWIRCASSP